MAGEETAESHVLNHAIKQRPELDRPETNNSRMFSRYELMCMTSKPSYD